MNLENEILLLEEQINIDKEFLFNHPEEGLKEFKTRNYILERLRKIGIEDIKTDIYETGIVATIKGENDGPCILFRSELDAVVMDETGRTKHTCGHHAHMTVLLALAELLKKYQKQLRGTAKLVFEPDEEGSGGAKEMISNGVLETPKVDKAFAIHVWSEFEEDTVSIKSGSVMASTDPFEIVVTGKGGHAALPEKCVDTIYIANKIGIAIKEMANLSEDEEKIVLGITAITAGKNNNVIPDKAYLKGICRTFNNKIRNETKEKLELIVKNIAEEMGGEAKIKFVGNYPATINSENESREVLEISKKIVTKVEEEYKTMCSEDFSYFLEKVPGAMIFVGCKKDKYYPQHNENFTVGTKPILIGTQIFFEICKKYLM